MNITQGPATGNVTSFSVDCLFSPILIVTSQLFLLFLVISEFLPFRPQEFLPFPNLLYLSRFSQVWYVGLVERRSSALCKVSFFPHWLQAPGLCCLAQSYLGLRWAVKTRVDSNRSTYSSLSELGTSSYPARKPTCLLS